MAKARAVYLCQQCGAQFPSWLGRCPECQSWNSLSAEHVLPLKASERRPPADPILIDQVSFDALPHFSTGLAELDRVLGGGVVPGEVVLLAGDPGIGKSTLLLQVASSVDSTLYITGEESPAQVKLRHGRLHKQAPTLSLLPETDVDVVIEVVKRLKPTLVIIDSIQTLTTIELPGSAGSVGQVRECAQRLTRIAKELQSAMFLVGHVTKEGTVAGPKTVEHVVDATILMEGDGHNVQRLLRCLKNRFGPTQELGIVRMEEHGFFDELNPSQLFLEEQTRGLPGSSLVVILEGNRPLLVEIQALVVPTNLPVPRRVAAGLDINRLYLLLAVLTRHAGISFAQSDVYINIVGGLTIREPAADLGIALALVGSLRGEALPPSLVAVGEIGLLGEVRPVRQQALRVKEAKRLGYPKVLTASEAATVREALRFIAGKA